MISSDLKLTTLELSSLSYSLSGHHQSALQSHVTNFVEGFKWCNHALPCAQCILSNLDKDLLRQEYFDMLSTLRRDLNGATHALPSTLPSNLDKDLRPEQKMFHIYFACLTSLALSSTQSCLISKSRSFDPPPPPTPFIVKS